MGIASLNPILQAANVIARSDLSATAQRAKEQATKQSGSRHSGMVRQHQTSDAQLRIEESFSGLDAEPVIGPAIGRTRWHRPGMTAASLLLPASAAPSPTL